MISGSRRALRESVLGGPGNPLRQHRQRAARLLVLRQRLPLALEDRERRRVERVARLEAGLQELPGLRLGRRGIHGGPLGRKLRAPLEAPVAEGLGDVLADLLAAEVLEQPPADDLADFGLVVGDQVLGDAPTTFEILSCHCWSHSVISTWLRGRLITAARCVVPTIATVRVVDEGVERLGHVRGGD